MRIRTIKPEFWTSEDVASMDWETRLVFLGLWSYVDDNGVGRDNEKLIVADLFPLEDDPREALARVSRGLQILESGGQIARYEIGGRRFMFIRQWDRHQRIDRPGKIRYPRPDLQEVPDPPDDEVHSRESRDELAPGTGEQGNRGTTTRSSDDEPVRAGEQGVLLVAVPAQRSGATEPKKRLTLDDHFEAWWKLYPRKQAKGAARDSWDRARKLISIEELLAAVQRLVDDPNLPRNRAKLPLPATWLNQKRWDDDPYPADQEAPGHRGADGELDEDTIVAVLGRDTWMPPTPPEDLQPGSAAFRQWNRDIWAEHHRDRRRQAESALARRTA